MHNEKEQRILNAAQSVFFRYGYARTTMADVAETGGISRPTLYLVFPSKEELFSAVIYRMTTSTLQTIRKGLGDQKKLEEKLVFAFDQL